MLRAVFQPRALVPTVTAGLIGGLLGVIWGISDSALIFSGSLTVYLGQGIALSILSAVFLNLAAAFGSSAPFMISNAQEALAIIIAVGMAPMAGTLESQHPSHVLPTVVAVIAVSSVCTGTFFVGLGAFHLGRLVRFVPFPVIGGFLAGTGWLIVLGAMQVLTGVNPTVENAGRLLEASQVQHIGAGVLFAAILLVLVNRVKHVLLLPALLCIAVAVFATTLALTGTSLSTAETEGWLLGPFTREPSYPPLALSDFARIDWPSVLTQAATIATVVIVAVVSLLLNVTGIEVDMGDDLDVNAELLSCGAGNILAGLAGGLPGFQVLSSSLMARRLGAVSRVTGVVAALVALAVLAAGASSLAYIPRFLLGGILLYLGADLLLEWVVRGYTRMTHIDFAMVVFILLVIGIWGLLSGFVAGVLLAVVTFVVSYSRAGAIRQELSGVTYRSSVDRSPAELSHLSRYGNAIQILSLHGVLFFGTATSVLDTIRKRLEDPSRPPLQFVVLDCRLVTGADASISTVVTKLQSMARRDSIVVLIAGLQGSARDAFRRSGAVEAHSQGLVEFPDLDRAVEWCERTLLRQSGARLGEDRPLVEQLTDYLGSREFAEGLMRYLERISLPASTRLLEQGAPSDDLYLVESGELTVLLRAGSTEVRLRTITAGALIGEIGFYLGTPRTASIVTLTPTTLYRLSGESLKEMRRSEPALTVAFTEIMVRMMARRVLDSESRAGMRGPA